MNALTTALVAWFLSSAGIDTPGACGPTAGGAPPTCPAGAPPPDAGTQAPGPTLAPLPGGGPGARPSKGDGIYNGI